MMQEQQMEPINKFRALMDKVIVRGCTIALAIVIVLWATAIVYAKTADAYPIFSLFITILLSGIGLVMIVRYVDVAFWMAKRYHEKPANEDQWVLGGIAAGATCVWIAGFILGCLSAAGSLEQAHYFLLLTVILLVGYQTWRAIFRPDWS